MGHKVNPIALRIGYIKNWSSMWFAKHGEFSKCIEEDYKIRKFIKKGFKQAAISKIIIERLAQRVRIRIHTARPGIIIGRHGADIERLRGDLNSMVNREVSIDIEEVKDPSLDAQLISENVALQLEKRVAYRRAIKRVVEQAMSSGAQGIRIVCSGRLGGAEMSRKETYKQGKIPLQTLRADIDYGFAEALTTYGLIGIKTWVYKGDILFSKDKEKVAVEVVAEDKDKKAKEAGESKEAPAA
jgi:small subunit ribosomal protein S3